MSAQQPEVNASALDFWYDLNESTQMTGLLEQSDPDHICLYHDIDYIQNQVLIAAVNLDQQFGKTGSLWTLSIPLTGLAREFHMLQRAQAVFLFMLDETGKKPDRMMVVSKLNGKHLFPANELWEEISVERNFIFLNYERDLHQRYDLIYITNGGSKLHYSSFNHLPSSESFVETITKELTLPENCTATSPPLLFYSYPKNTPVVQSKILMGAKDQTGQCALLANWLNCAEPTWDLCEIEKIIRELRQIPFSEMEIHMQPHYEPNSHRIFLFVDLIQLGRQDSTLIWDFSANTAFKPQHVHSLSQHTLSNLSLARVRIIPRSIVEKVFPLQYTQETTIAVVDTMVNRVDEETDEVTFTIHLLHYDPNEGTTKLKNLPEKIINQQKTSNLHIDLYQAYKEWSRPDHFFLFGDLLKIYVFRQPDPYTHEEWREDSLAQFEKINAFKPILTTVSPHKHLFFLYQTIPSPKSELVCYDFLEQKELNRFGIEPVNSAKSVAFTHDEILLLDMNQSIFRIPYFPKLDNAVKISAPGAIFLDEPVLYDNQLWVAVMEGEVGKFLLNTDGNTINIPAFNGLSIVNFGFDPLNNRVGLLYSAQHFDGQSYLELGGSSSEGSGVSYRMPKESSLKGIYSQINEIYPCASSPDIMHILSGDQLIEISIAYNQELRSITLDTIREVELDSDVRFVYHLADQDYTWVVTGNAYGHWIDLRNMQKTRQIPLSLYEDAFLPLRSWQTADESNILLMSEGGTWYVIPRGNAFDQSQRIHSGSLEQDIDGSTIHTAPHLYSNMFFCGTDKGNVYQVDISTGKARTIYTGSGISSRYGDRLQLKDWSVIGIGHNGNRLFIAHKCGVIVNVNI
ncbi:hypothetical protein CEE37_14480 [candidate division LCP-89 bacterium B3_LCP]|uniref:Uncharacterized protein n=1 Tax=candidate division LCP-89 bacterium B3_LCP TaxID=2012998 RepID=A0A532UPQ6_UNCL8|nr:MAG: hypothetical protein CEE37_14480 [candidate division LCP-89 bacterium B3_LCP]